MKISLMSVPKLSPGTGSLGVVGLFAALMTFKSIRVFTRAAVR